jgi:pimeloyl-ACP methyl ester carboxylesterase
MTNSCVLYAIGGVLGWGIIEFVHYVKVRQLASQLQSKKSPQPYWFNDPVNVVHEIYENCKTDKGYSFEKFLTTVHLGADVNSIYTENYESFLAWYLYLSHRGDLSNDQRQVVTNLCEKAVQLFGLPCQSGYNTSISHCTLGLDNLEYLHQPLLFYGLLGGINLVHNFFIKWNGFQMFQTHSVNYWFYKHPFSLKPPILFFHGMGPGWSSYAKMISELSKDRSIILVCYDAIVLDQLEFEVPDYKTLVTAVEAILMEHNISSVSLIGHSWGTFLAGWIVKSIPQKVSQLCMIDPIATFVPYPDTIYFVVYKPPSGWKDYLFHYFFRRNITISNALSRNFAWYNMVLRFDEIPESMNVVISLSGKDDLIDVPAAVEMTETFIAKRSNARLLYWENYYHGDAKDNKESIDGILEAIQVNETHVNKIENIV